MATATTPNALDERVKIFEEIKDTERRYLEHLGMLNTTYLVPLQQKKIGPQGKEFKNLISTLSMIINFNDFLNKMLHKTNAESVGKIFQQVIPFLKTYREYFNNYEKAQNDIRHHKKENKKFAEWLEKTERECKKKNQLTMNQLLIMPIQRIPRYNLLLRELIKNTSDDHPDYKDLNDALLKSAEVSDFLNEQIKEMDNSHKLLHLSKLIVVNQQSRAESLVIVLPHRKFVHEGMLGICNDTDPTKNPQERYFFLFSDMLLCCAHIQKDQLGFMKNQEQKKKKRKGSKRYDDEDEELAKVQPEYFVHKPIHFLGARRDTTENISLPFVRSFESTFCERFQKNTIFQLITMKETYTFQCKTAEECAKWVGLCQKVIDELVRIYNRHDQEKAVPKCYPAVLRAEAALFVQKIYRGNVARREMKKEEQSKPVVATKPVSPRPVVKEPTSVSPRAVSPRPIQTVSPRPVVSPRAEQQTNEKKLANDDKREIERKRHEETELYKKQQEMAKRKQENEQERIRVEKERKQLEEEREEARKRHEAEQKILQEARRKEEEEKRKHEEMEEIERIKEATRVEEERVKREKEHLEQMHQLELKQREADMALRKKEAPSQVQPTLQTKLRPTPRPKFEASPTNIDDANLSPWQREIMNRYKSKEKTNFVVVREVESRPLTKKASSHSLELEQLSKIEARKSSVSQILQRFEQKSSPNEQLPLSARKKT